MVPRTMSPQSVWVLLLVMIGVYTQPSGKLSKGRNIYLGLYSSKSSDNLTVVYKPDDYLPCYNFTKENSTTEECKFYGDCCVDPMRIRDRLEPGTFSCQTTPGYTGELVYVVDRCPSLTEDKKLVTLCEQTESESSISMATWPVTAIRTGVLYKNMFCALCHGVLAEKYVWDTSIDYSKSVDFWWLSVNCITDTISQLTEEYERFSVANLEPFIRNSECGLRFSPPSQPHRCLDAVRSCPDNFTDVELKLLCEQGPVSYTEGAKDIMYRNYFCQLCHDGCKFYGPVRLKTNKTTSTPPGKPTVAQIKTTDEESRWPNPLIKIQPQLQLKIHLDLSPDDYLTDNRSNTPNTKRIALTNNILESYEYSVKTFDPPTNSYWDFGSLLYDSLHKGICDKLISRQTSGCGGPGCGLNSWQDANSKCYESSNYTYDPSSRQQANYIWPHSLYGRYSSSCNPEAGLDANWHGVNCRCDQRCHYFDECCFDTPLPENYIHPRETLKYSCVQPEQCQSNNKYNYAIISKCPTGSDKKLRQLCNQGEIGDWSPVGWTVYDTETNLSYKNVYCAMCNDVSPERVKFWQAYFDCPQNKTMKTNTTEEEQLYDRKWLGDCSFIRFIPKDPEIAYMCYSPPIVSSCPYHLADWKIADDCVNEPTSWVSYNQTLYRNAYCAICNLDDEIMKSDIDPDEAHQTTSASASQSLYSDLVYRPRGSVILDVSENKCCYQNECMLNTHSLSEHSPWGKIGFGYSAECLTKLPFYTACEENSFERVNTEPVNLTFLCSGSFTPLPNPPQGCSGSPSNSGTRYRPTISFTKLLFTDFGEIPLTHTYIRNTNWIEVNDSLLMCSNGTIVITTTGEHYSKLRLSPSTIEVKQKVITEKVEEPSLEDYDYILLSLSLLSLSAYIIYIGISKKQRSFNLTELMKLSVLISLFGALLSYSLANIPAGEDLIGCQALAAMQQFLFLSTFTWTSALGINITQIIYSMQQVSSQKKRFIWFAVYAVGLPITMVMTTFTLSEYQKNIAAFKSPVYRMYGICFLHETYIINSLFLAPIYIIVASNVILCIICMVRIGRTAGITTHDEDRWKKNILTCIKLSVCMGLAWILLFFISPESESLDIAFKILVEINGFLVVAANVISWKCIRKAQQYTVSRTFTTAVSSTAVNGSQSVELSNRSSDQPKASV